MLHPQTEKIHFFFSSLQNLLLDCSYANNLFTLSCNEYKGYILNVTFCT